MATVDLTKGGTTYLPAIPGEVVKMEKQLDFSATSRSAADVLQLFDIPAGARVLTATIQVDTAEGGTATADLGDGDDPNGYIATANLNSAAYTGVTTEAYADGRTYTAADTIDLVLGHDMDAAKIKVTAWVLMPSPYKAAD